MSQPISSSLISALEGTKADTVYLPPRISTCDAKQKTSNNLDDARAQLAAETYFKSGDALHGDTLPVLALASEKPIHRVMIYLHAQGASLQDIARHTGYTYQYVTQVMRQPWARQRLMTILKESCQDAVKHFLTHEVAPSLEVLREVRDSSTASAQAKIAASNSILDRALGKPTVTVESASTIRNVPADMQRIEADLAAVRSQLESKGATVHGASN
jgi:DNA-binding MarR family transcriptional regulator